MEDLDDWRLCGELTVIEATLLTLGIDPAGTQERVEKWKPDERPRGYAPVKAAIWYALQSGKIEGTLLPRRSFDEREFCFRDIQGSMDIERSKVEVESLREWFSSRGRRPAFFFPPEEDEPAKENEPEYLDPGNLRYPPKLAAAVHAWQAVTDPGPKHPRQALKDWLVENAAEVGLTDEKGKLNNKGIEQVAAVANWRPRGGAPRTPNHNPSPL